MSHYHSCNANLVIDSYAICPETLTTTDWDDVFRYDTVSGCYDSFNADVTNKIDIHAPERKTTIPSKAIIREPWMTPGLIKSSNELD